MPSSSISTESFASAKTEKSKGPKLHGLHRPGGISAVHLKTLQKFSERQHG